MPTAIISFATLCAFTVHAVIGCCLLHGDCGERACDSIVEACAATEAAPVCCGGTHHHAAAPPQGTLTAAAGSYCAMACHPHDGSVPPHHCDDARCVYSISAATAVKSVAFTSVDEGWGVALRVESLVPRVVTHTISLPRSQTGQASPPQRAALQVWVI